jgi:hypothetical protein
MSDTIFRIILGLGVVLLIAALGEEFARGFR